MEARRVQSKRGQSNRLLIHHECKEKETKDGMDAGGFADLLVERCEGLGDSV